MSSFNDVILFLLSPQFLHLVSALAALILVANITASRTSIPRYIPDDQGNNVADPNPPVPHWFSGASRNRGIVACLITTLIVYPVFSYTLWTDIPGLAFLLLVGTVIVPFLFGMILPNLLGTPGNGFVVSPAAGFWSLVGGSSGWVANWCLDWLRVLIRDPVSQGYTAIPWHWVGFWFTAAFLGVMANIFVWVFVLRWVASFENWFIRLMEPGDGVVVGFAGHFVRIIANLTSYQVVNTSNPHAPHIPPPADLDLNDRALAFRWLMFGADAIPGWRIRNANGVLVPFRREWAGTFQQRVTQTLGFTTDDRAWHVLPTLACFGVPALSELIGLSGDTLGLAHGAHGVAHHGHGGHDDHAHIRPTRFTFRKKTDNFKGRPVPSRSGIDWKVELGYQMITIFAERANNVVSVHNVLHQWMDDLVAFLSSAGNRLLGRTGPASLLSTDLDAVAEEWLAPAQDFVARVEGIELHLDELGMNSVADTGEAIINVVVEDVNLDEATRGLLRNVVDIYFRTSKAVIARVRAAYEAMVSARVKGATQALIDAGMDPADATRQVGAALPSFFLPGNDQGSGLLSYLNIGNILNPGGAAPSGGRGGGGGGGARGGGGGGGTPPLPPAPPAGGTP